MLLTAAHQSYHELKSPIALKIRVEIEAARRAMGHVSQASAVSVDQAIQVAMAP
jgi:hypothetical protein